MKSSQFIIRKVFLLFQSLRGISLQDGNQIVAKSPLKSQENRKCKRVFIVTLFEFDTLSHKGALYKCVTIVDGHTRCLVACYVTNLLSIHSPIWAEVFQILCKAFWFTRFPLLTYTYTFVIRITCSFIDMNTGSPS